VPPEAGQSCTTDRRLRALQAAVFLGMVQKQLQLF
jgi:hypothetical protein